MREVTTKIYQFDELDEKIKEKVLIDLTNINVDYDWWNIDGLLDLSGEEMKEKKIELGEIKDVLFSYKIRSFNLDGGRYLQMENIVVNNEDVFRRFLEIPKDLWDQCTYQFLNPVGSMTGKNNTYLEIEADDYEALSDEEAAIFERAEEIMAGKFYEAWKMLKSDYEYFTSNEAIEETINSNEYEFYEDGRMF